MKKQMLISILLMLALSLAACGTAVTATATDQPTAVSQLDTPTDMAPTSSDTPASIDTPTGSETPVSMDTPTGSETPASMDTPTGSETPVVPVTGGGGATLAVSQKSGVTGSFLVDANGNTVYLYTQDTQNGSVSACTGTCATNWLPVTVTGTPTAGTGVDASKLSTIKRDDGSTQVTYNGWPLYRFAQDMAPGDTNGQGKGGFWYLISPTGDALKG